uniref:Zinc finger PHD-type domain-containing protein n=1 Tax=Salix viminalis TaxID=40686 RepID=A0A6N2KIE7_SALVM
MNNPTNAVKKLLHSLSKKRVTRSSHPPTISKMSESSALYIVEGSCKETLLTFYQQSQREAERIVFLLSILMVLQLKLTSTVDTQHRTTSESSALNFTTLSVLCLKSCQCNFIYRRSKLHGNPITFLSAQVPAVAKKSGDDFLSVMSYDGPSAVRKKQSLMSLHEHGAFHMPPPVFNREDSPCPFSLQRSPQLPTASTMPEISALEEALEVSQDKHECKAGRAVPRPPLASSGEPHVSNQNLAVDVLLLKTCVLIRFKNNRPKIFAVDSINDSSSSKSNMELVSASTKTEGDDNSECSSSNWLFEGVWHGRICGSAKRTGDSRSSLSCKKRFCAESLVKMLICDNCEDSFHVSCCNPRLKRIPMCSKCHEHCHNCRKDMIQSPRKGRVTIIHAC